MLEIIKDFPSKKRLIISIILLLFSINLSGFDGETLANLPTVASFSVVISISSLIIKTTLFLTSLIMMFYACIKMKNNDEEAAKKFWKIGIIMNNLAIICFVINLIAGTLSWIIIDQTLTLA